MMPKEIWGAYFSSDFQSSGTGVAIIEGNSVMGGTSAYYFTGECDRATSPASARLFIKKFAPGKTVLDEMMSQYTLVLTGDEANNEMLLTGYIEERPDIKMSCRMKKLKMV